MDNELDALNALLEGNTPPTPPAPEDQTTPEDTAQDLATDGGDPNLDSDSTPEPDGDAAAQEAEAERSKQNAAFAKMRAENAKLSKVMSQLAQALGLDAKDPNSADKLAELAIQKLATAQNVPVELYKELNVTKEQLQQLQTTQNLATAREKFGAIQTTHKLTQQELMAFATQLDNEGIIVVNDPSVDLDYHYYRLHREKIEQKRIDAAVEAALKKSNTADTKSTTPPKQSSKTTDTSTAQINSVSALNDLMDGK